LPEDSGFPAFVAQRIEHLTTDQKVGVSVKPSTHPHVASPSEGMFLALLAHLPQNFR